MSSHADAEPRDGDDSEDRRDFGDSGDPRDIADVGLLNPVSAGSAAEPLTSDQAVVTALVRAEAALLRALVTTGIAPESALPAAAVLESARPDPRRLALAASTGGNPVIPLVAELREHMGAEHAAWVHHGATSQDILDTALMLVGAQAARCVTDDLTRLAGTLATLADETRDLPVAGRTLTQQALPTTVGMRAAGWLAGVLDALGAVRGCLPLPVSLAGPVGTASVYAEKGPAMLEAFADSLGQAAPLSPWHTRRTPVLRFGAALVETGAACGKIAADVLVLAQSEVGELREGTAGPSSAMAHKANPAQAVLVASAARQLPALSAVLAGSAVAEQERPAGAWHAEWQTLRTLIRLAAGAAERTADLTAALRLDREAMRRNLDQLVGAVEQDPDWVASRTAHVDVWIDRVLVRYEEVVR